ncbi:YozQ family protein [Brevibacillus dissolubilis]|uniref:YozQ family protein n=1 Tax=Brevibacillus dissolubilis TaxID=1844116 RepID=UPI0011171460|nr:YozQ family protein [Brevibacillus dissolubilis]
MTKNNTKNPSLDQYPSGEIAEKTYHVEDYQSSNTVDKGLALSHEMTMDDYYEGNNGGKIDAFAGHAAKEIPTNGYEGVFPNKK